jgi:hypothetical protein
VIHVGDAQRADLVTTTVPCLIEAAGQGTPMVTTSVLRLKNEVVGGRPIPPSSSDPTAPRHHASKPDIPGSLRGPDEESADKGKWAP